MLTARQAPPGAESPVVAGPQEQCDHDLGNRLKHPRSTAAILNPAVLMSPGMVQSVKVVTTQSTLWSLPRSSFRARRPQDDFPCRRWGPFDIAGQEHVNLARWR